MCQAKDSYWTAGIGGVRLLAYGLVILVMIAKYRVFSVLGITVVGLYKWIITGYQVEIW